MKQCSKGHDMTPENTYKNGRCGECGRERAQRLWRESPEYRERKNASKRERYRLNRDAMRAVERERYARDENFRRRKIEQAKRYAEMVKTDPQKAADRREARRFYSEGARRRKGIEPRQWGSRAKPRGGRDRTVAAVVDIGPFIGWLDEWLANHPDVTESVLAERAGSNDRSVYAWRTGEREKIQLSVVDRYLLAAGESPYILDELYPLDELMAAA